MREYVLVLLVTAAVTFLLTPLVRRLAVATNAIHAPRARDTHTKPTPLLGGLAMYGGLVAGLILTSRLTALQDPFQAAGSKTAAGLLLAGALIVVVGFVDDRWGLSAISKLAGQVAAAGILVWSGQSLPWLPTPSGGEFPLEPDLSVTLTILLVVITINAINFIDGLDGLAAGIVAVAALSFLVYSYTLLKTIGNTSQSLPAVSSALLAGMCLGFLPHNFYPARIFMGDIGAMLLGLMLAYGPISSTASLDPADQLRRPQPHPGPVPDLPAAAGPRRDLHHPVRRPDVRHHPPHQGGQAGDGRRPAAPAPPGAQHRPFLPAERADHVPVGGPVLGHGRLAVGGPDPPGRVRRRDRGRGPRLAARHHAEPAPLAAVPQAEGHRRRRPAPDGRGDRAPQNRVSRVSRAGRAGRPPRHRADRAARVPRNRAGRSRAQRRVLLRPRTAAAP
jgi:UDP-N-acetylmuramyl pentapeptide phosphotransferase/UDP-N-acetylglucosamine-1-phosphate transferase